jgi:cytochrome c-type biogenesis protein CcmH/NrfG
MVKRSWPLALVSAALVVAVVAGVALLLGNVRTAGARGGQSAVQAQAREEAYRSNNLGVALLEQFDYGGAAAAFRTALQASPALALARVNLSIALLYGIDLDNAQREAEEAARLLPSDPRPHYLLGLIARAQGRTDAAREAFERVRQIDARDVGTQINIGQIHLQQQHYPEALAAFRAAIAEEPYNVTAAYSLGLALTRAGQRDEGRQAMEHSQALRTGGYGTVFSNNYLEQGRYAEAMASTGAERELVDPGVPDVTFVSGAIDSTPIGSSSPAVASPFGRRFGANDLADDGRALAGAVAGGIALLDFDGDGDLDVFAVGAGRTRLLRNDRGAYVDVTTQSGLADILPSGGIACVAGDYDNDGAPDLLVLRYGANVLLHNDGGGRFSDATSRARLPQYPFLSTSAAFVDFDHDGDLDIVIAGLADLKAARDRAGAGGLVFPDDFPGAPTQLVQNDGNGTFTDISSKTRVDGLRHAVAVVPTDYDNRRDVDLLIVSHDGAPALFTNLRDGTFRDDAARVGLHIEGRVTSVAAGDFNKDEFPDFFLGRAGAPGMFAVSDGRGRFGMVEAPAATAGATAAQFLDYDNDGLIDLFVWTSGGPRLLRNVAGDWIDVTTRAFQQPGAGASPVRLISAGTLAAADIDDDGDRDVIAADGSRGLVVWRNEGGNRNKSIRVRLSGRVSNRSGVGAKVDVRAGSLRQRLETAASTPLAAPADVVFGLGSRAGADVVRVLWPSGVLQAETASPGGAALTSPVTVEELNRKPSSCPFLYTWNGSRFEFVTDFMGGGEMGYWEAPGVRNRPDPVEYVRIRESQLRPKDGRYEIRVTNELEETMFVDRLSLLAITHPSDVEVFPNEGMTDPPKPFRLFQARASHPPPRVTDDDGHDVTARIADIDGRYPDDFPLSAIRGYAARHALTMPLGGMRPDLMLLTGWTDYAFSSDNVAAHQAGLTPEAPTLQARAAGGAWRTIADDIGIPVGRPQTLVVDLARVLPAGATEMRLVTNMRIYWDQILFAERAHEPLRVERLDAQTALLRVRGFSAEIAPGPPQPITYDYERVTRRSPWKTMSGAYTREGDVRPLLVRTDDRFVIAAPGDEIALSFTGGRVGRVGQVGQVGRVGQVGQVGLTRTFLLYADGFSKEMDVNSSSPDVVEPLPFHGMAQYPYPASKPDRDTRAMQRYRAQYNTRRLHKILPPLDLRN